MAVRGRWRGLPPLSLCQLLSLPLLLLMIVSENSVASGSVNDGPLEFSDIMPENPRDYDKMAPPKGGNEPTTVYFHVTVMSLDSIDESSMTYAADIFFAQSWKDWRLRLPDNMTHEYRLLPVNWLKDIWRPDSFFKNAKAVTFQEMTIPNHYIWLYQDNTILYMVKLTLVLSCAMNFQVYPHDTQECHMKIESLSHTTDDLVFMWDPEVPVEVERSIELPQLDLVKRYTGDCTQVYSTGNFTCLEIVFTFKRRLGYYLFHTYIPTCLIVIMSWISFWIRPEAVPARVTLGVTSLLTLSTQHANSQKSLPPVSYIKAIDVFMSSCTVFVFFSLMEYALVNVLLGDVPEEPEVRMRMRPRTLFQEAESPKKVTECLGSSRAGDYEASPARSNKSECSGQPPPPCLTAQRRSPAVERRPNGRKALCQTELDAITTITSPLASPANGMSPLEMTAVNPAAATAAATAASSSSSSSCPAHLSPSSHMTTSHMVNGPMFSGMHLGERKRRSAMQQQQQQQQQHYHHHSSNSGAGCGGGGSSGSGMLQHHGAVQHSSMHNYGTIQNQQGMQLNLTFGLPPPPPPPHFGPGKATGKSRAQKQARLRERAILIDRVSRILFPVSFTVLNIIYWSVFVIEWF